MAGEIPIGSQDACLAEPAQRYIKHPRADFDAKALESGPHISSQQVQFGWNLSSTPLEGRKKSSPPRIKMEAKVVPSHVETPENAIQIVEEDLKTPSDGKDWDAKEERSLV